MLAGWGTIDGTQVMAEATARLAMSDLFPDTLAADGGFTRGSRRFGFGAGGLVGNGEAAGLFGWFGAAGTVGLVNTNVGLRQTLMTQYMPAEEYDLQQLFAERASQDAARILAAAS